MLPAESRDDGRQTVDRQPQRSLALPRQALQQGLRFGGQRIARLAEDARGGVMEFRRERLDMQLGDEELRNRLGLVGMAIGPAGHARAGERIEAGNPVAERLEYAGEAPLARRQGPGGAFEEAN